MKYFPCKPKFRQRNGLDGFVDFSSCAKLKSSCRLSLVLKLSKVNESSHYTRNDIWPSCVRASILGQKLVAPCIQKIENRLVYNLVIYSSRV